MANKKTNEILEEQKRAREEFLRLKKMQHGELAPEPKPSEMAEEQTAVQKRQNFWFYNKWKVIAIIATAMVLCITVSQCINRPKYDLEVIYFTYSAALDNQTEKIEPYFEKYCEDLNGDGEVNVKVINCSIPIRDTNVQYRNQVYTKIQSILVANEKSMLFITDNESITYFDNISKERSLFTEEPILLGEEFYKETVSEDFGELPEGLQVSCRAVYDDSVNVDEDFIKYNQAAQRLLEKLKKDN